MALLPILFLLTIAAAMWAFRDRPARFRWTLFGGAAVVTWGAVIGLLAATPSSTALSVWQPAPLFRSRLEFVLDDVGWTMAFVMATNLLVSSAYMASGTRATTEIPATFMLGLSAVSMAGVMAGNLASLLASWALFDLILLVRRLSSAGEVGNQSGGGLAIFSDLLSLMMILLATATLEDPAASGALSASPLGTVLLALAAFLRILGGRRPSRRSDAGEGDGFPRVVAAGLGSSLLLRLMAGGIPPDMLAAQGMACLLATFSAVWWVGRWREAGSERYLLTSLVGYGVLASTASASDGERLALAAAALALCVAPMIAHRQIYQGVHRIAAATMALLVCGLPTGIGGAVVGGIVSSVSGSLSLAIAAASILGLGLLAGGLLLHARQPIEPWPAGEALPRGLFTLAKLMPVLAAAGLGLQLGSLPTAEGGVAFLIATAVALATSRVLHRGTSWASGRQRALSSWFDFSGVGRVARGVIEAGRRGFYGLSSLLEGEGAMLWVLVLLLVVLLGWSSG